MAREFVNETEQNRYAMRIDGDLVSVVDYRIRDNMISFHHTYTAPTHRGQGLAAEILEFAVNDVEANTQYRIVPMCWYVGQWFEQHPERAELLSR